MENQLSSFIEARNEALDAYSLSGEVVDRARYNKQVRMLREFITANNIKMDETDIDILMYEKQTLKREPNTEKLTLDGFDDNIDEEYI